MLRQHKSLLRAGVDSVILTGDRKFAADSRISKIDTIKRSFLSRAILRLRLPIDSRVRLERNIRRILFQHPTAKYEVLSIPYSDFAPEIHPWIRDTDVINVHWTSGCLDWPRFFKNVRNKITITLHDQNPYLGLFHYESDSQNNPYFSDCDNATRLIKQHCISHTVLSVIGNSQWNTRKAKNSAFFPEGCTFDTVYYPLDLDIYTPLDKILSRSQLGIKPDAFIIGFASDDLNNKRKGFDILVKAIAEIDKSQCPNLFLLSFGKQNNSIILDELSIPNLNLGFIENDRLKVLAYSAMDAFVVPSRAEAFGQTAIEAIASGTCVIASAVDGLKEAVFDGQAGILFDPDDTKSLQDGILLLRDSPKIAKTLIRNGIELVKKRHKYEICSGDLIQIFSRIHSSKFEGKF